MNVDLAAHSGKDASQLLKDAAMRLLDNDVRSRAGVKRGIAAADRGDFLNEEEMEARIEQLLRS